MRKIMIVDDNYLSAEGIEKNIDWEVLNAEIVHICYNGTSAIDAMKKEPVDLIISDIEMPDLDGISMSRQALDINPMVKIILISCNMSGRADIKVSCLIFFCAVIFCSS